MSPVLINPYVYGGGGGGGAANKITFLHDDGGSDKTVYMDLDGGNKVEVTGGLYSQTFIAAPLWIPLYSKFYISNGNNVDSMDLDGSNLTTEYAGSASIKSLHYDALNDRIWSWLRSSGNGVWGYFDNIGTTFDWNLSIAAYRGNQVIDPDNDRYFTQIYDTSSSILYEKVLSTDAAVQDYNHGATIKSLAIDLTGGRLFVTSGTVIKVYSLADITAGPTATILSSNWSATSGIWMAFDETNDKLILRKSGTNEVRSLPASNTSQDYNVHATSLVVMNASIGGIGVATI